ncbi:hypothetical protein [Tetragenococcus halophilus]|uniref:Uncharacterized protein n=1 Tax=Tetragenococcus halophilus (strain DSM 20338 / JCM 20259 / NCIMB 9735 / NBRC 12172) TaxID=945021 RepID=A0AAN1VQV8_TETHN|nr:hypothetical protein [Tetragenococcus halophilus]BAK93751.1 hypothetical protein TEH_04240 [Tetragenococcus halophilus NBRC 12172]GBD71582.1 putative uncharacterized protein [Tetragenococcus halophilus subsp. halophilus]
MNKKETYLNLLSKSYDEAVEVLQQKYDQVKDDYFKEKSYERFLKGEIKGPGRADYSRYKEGLECHHIDENKFSNMAEPSYIKNQKIPFKYQKKDRLVYCDYVEHVILHALISKETNGQLGLAGYDTYLRKNIYYWYLLEESIPKTKKVAIYKRAYLKPKEALEILKATDNAAYENRSSNPFIEPLPEMFEDLEKFKLKKQKEFEEFRKKKQRLKEMKKTEISRAKSISENSSAYEIIKALYKLKNTLSKVGRDTNDFCNFSFEESHDEYQHRMSKYVTNELLKELELIIQYGDSVISICEFEKSKNQNPKTKEQLEKERELNESFYVKHPNFRDTNIDYTTNKQAIAAELFKRRYKNEYKSFMKFQSSIKKLSTESLLDELHSVMVERREL